MADAPLRIRDRLDTRSFIAIELATSMVALTFVLALRAPDSDAFKILLGAMLTVGFAGVIGWYFNSSAGSEKKDDTQAKVAERLADKITPSVGVTAAGPIPWWNMLSGEEQAAITKAGEIDGTIKTFTATAAVGKAKPEDLAYLVTAGLLTKERASAIQAVI